MKFRLFVECFLLLLVLLLPPLLLVLWLPLVGLALLELLLWLLLLLRLPLLLLLLLLLWLLPLLWPVGLREGGRGPGPATRRAGADGDDHRPKRAGVLSSFACMTTAPLHA